MNLFSVRTAREREGHALAAALERMHASGAAIGARTRRNLAALARAVGRSALGLLDVEGGWYATLSLPATRSDEDWALSLLERDAVLTQPGWLYDFSGGPYLVLSLLPREPDFDEGVARLCARVRTG